MEISNVGVDIVNIERFRKKEYSKNKKFYEKSLVNQKYNTVYLLRTIINILQVNLL